MLLSKVTGNGPGWRPTNYSAVDTNRTAAPCVCVCVAAPVP